MSDSPPPPPPPPPASPRKPPEPAPSAAPQLSRSNSASSVPVQPSKLLQYAPLDAPDDLDRNWAWHFATFQKALPGERDANGVLLKFKSLEGFEKHTAMLYGCLTAESTSDRDFYWQVLHALMLEADNIREKSIHGLQALIEIRFQKLSSTSSSNLRWLMEQAFSLNIDNVLIVLLRHMSPTSPLLSWFISFITARVASLSDTVSSHAFYTFASIAPESLASQNPPPGLNELCAQLYQEKKAAVLGIGRELLRISYETREALPSMWQDIQANHVAKLMNTATASKFVVCRLTAKMQEQLRFLTDKVLHVSAHRYQKWFQASFLQGPLNEGLIADIVRYICAVYHPSHQIVEAKMTPRYHILGWVFLLCKSQQAKSRVLHAMFFDYIYYTTEVSTMNLEPAMMLLLKSTKNRNVGMVSDILNFLVTVIEGCNDMTMADRVSQSITALLHKGVMRNLSHIIDALKDDKNLLLRLQKALPSHFAPMSNPPSTTSSPVSSPSHPQSVSPNRSPVRSPKSPQRGSPSTSSPDIHEEQWQEQSFLQERTQALETSVAPTLLPESLRCFEEQLQLLTTTPPQETEKLLNAISVVITAWSHSPNAIALSVDLGGFMYKCLERSFLTSLTTPQYVLEQCLQRPPQLYLPLLQGMFKHDSVMSHRLLVFCCTQPMKKPEEAFQPYLAFCELVGVEAPTAILQDLSLCVHVDEATALASSLLNTGQTIGSAVETTVLRVLPFLFQHSSFLSSSNALPRIDAMVRQLVSLATPCQLSMICMRVLLREFAIFRDHIATILLSSLQWNSFEQMATWELLAVEQESKKKDKGVLAALRKVLACMDPAVHGEALSGLLRLLMHSVPDTTALQCIMKLPDAFDPFPPSILAVWSEKHPAIVKAYLLSENKDTKDVLRQLNKLQACQEPVELLRDEDLRRAVTKCLEEQDAAEGYPALVELFIEGSPLKKQRTE